MFTKNDRVRIYLPLIGNIHATVVQDQSLSHDVLVHIDGTRRTDLRWIKDEHLHPETWPGEYARDRVSD